MYCQEKGDIIQFDLNENFDNPIVAIFDPMMQSWIVNLRKLKKCMLELEAILSRLRTTNLLCARYSGPGSPKEFIVSHQVLSEFRRYQTLMYSYSNDKIVLLLGCIMRLSRHKIILNLRNWELSIFKLIAYFLFQ